MQDVLDTTLCILFLKCYSGKSLNIKSKYSESILDMLPKNIIYIRGYVYHV
jgi:hypothetical protein